jgi:hypothetical protein
VKQASGDNDFEEEPLHGSNQPIEHSRTRRAYLVEPLRPTVEIPHYDCKKTIARRPM